jgi:serine/threonine-protein kinase
MRFDELKAAIQPTLSEDFDELRRSFEAETASDDPEELLAWLQDKGLVTQAALRVLYGVEGAAGRGTLAGQPSPSVAPPADPSPASLPSRDAFPGRGYEFVGKVGEGAMGEVLRAEDLDLHRTVAYKQMSAAIARDRALAGKFYSEAQITAQLEHPNIVPIYSLDRAPNGELAYTMKLIRGRTFDTLIQETRTLYEAGKPLGEAYSLATRLDYFLRVCEAIHFAHSRGVVHRDLKPENIMVGAYGEVYVMDWGIAQLMSAGKSRTPAPRAGNAPPHPVEWVQIEGYRDDEDPEPSPDADDDDPGLIIGTPQYMSPEQAHGRKDLDGRSDQYALGLILYELVSLRQAVTGKSSLKIVMRQQDGEKDPLVHVAKEKLPTELKAIIFKATTKDIGARYADVHQLAEDIRRYLRGEAVKARPDTPRQRVRRWVGRHRELTLLLVVLFFSISGLSIVGSQLWFLYSAALAAEHEQQLSNLLTAGGAQGAIIDSRFSRFQGLLGIVAASTSEMLLRGEPREERLYYPADFAAPETRPPDVEQSRRYNAEISLDHPVYLLARDASIETVGPMLQRLVPLQRYLQRVLLLSHSSEASSRTPKQARRLIADVGVPIAWVTVGLESGGYLGYPGASAYPEGFDPRARPWYKLAVDKREPRWGAPYIDTGGLGLVLPCSTALYDEEDHLLGVASVQLPFDYIINDLLVTKELPVGAESFLLDEEGRIVVRSSERGKTYDTATLRNRTIRMPDFPVPEVVAAIREERSGYVNVNEGGRHDLVLYNRMNSLGWYYVVQGEHDAMLAYE